MDDKLHSRRKFLTGCCAAMGAVAVGAGAIPTVSAWGIAEDLKFKLTEKDVDLAGIEPGQMKIDGISLVRSTLIGDTDLVVPVLILRRKPEWIAQTDKADYSMKEPVEVGGRYFKPEWFICRAFCTHLGCTPNIIDDTTDPVNIVCPCHGGRYDTIGRILSGPPPLNLYLIPYRFTAEDKIRLYISTPNDITLTSVSDFKKV